jgi:hypothetical protein
MSENKTKTSNTATAAAATTTSTTTASGNEISIIIPISQISEKIYSKTFDEESDPIYQKELQGRAIIAGKSITLLRFKPTLRLQDIKIASGNKGENGKAKAELTGKAWFHLLPKEDAKTHDENDYNSSQQDFRADLDISIDQKTGKIQINPRYAALEAKVGIANSQEEPFCQLTIPLKLESLKMELPVGVRTSTLSLPPPVKKGFIINSGSEFIEGDVGQDNNNIVFRYPIEIEEQKK